MDPPGAFRLPPDPFFYNWCRLLLQILDPPLITPPPPLQKIKCAETRSSAIIIKSALHENKFCPSDLIKKKTTAFYPIKTYGQFVSVTMFILFGVRPLKHEIRLDSKQGIPQY